MLLAKDVFEQLRENGVNFFAGVPDSLLKHFCAHVTNACPKSSHIISANEGGAIALAAGHYLTTGRVACVYLQNSGLGNTVNPLTSLADPAVYSVPMILLVGWRGQPGTKDAPQHVAMGAFTPATLDAIGVPAFVLPKSPEEARPLIQKALDTATGESRPTALLVQKDTFAPITLDDSGATGYTATREEAIASVLRELGTLDAVVSTTGMPSREVFELRNAAGEPHHADFLTVGAMGHASQIALGVALHRPGNNVICIDGDGAALMHMGGLATIGQSGASNFKHVIVNNGAHDSVGGQPTVGFGVDFCKIALGCGYLSARSEFEPSRFSAAARWVLDAPGPTLLELRVRKGARADLGRPTETPKQCRDHFMGFLQG